MGNLDHLKKVTDLLNQPGCDVNSTPSGEVGAMAALHWAALFRADRDVVAFLLDRGANIHDTGGCSRMTPLHQACSEPFDPQPQNQMTATAKMPKA